MYHYNNIYVYMLRTRITNINTLYFKRARLPRRLSTIDRSSSFCNRCSAKISRTTVLLYCKLSGPKEFDEFTSEEKRDSVISVAVSEKVVDNETLRNVFGIDMSRASTLLKQLVGDGTLCQIGPGGRWSKYVLSVELNRRLNDES